MKKAGQLLKQSSDSKEARNELVTVTGRKAALLRNDGYGTSSSDSSKDRLGAERHSLAYFRKRAGLNAFMGTRTVIKQALAHWRRERCCS